VHYISAKCFQEHSPNPKYALKSMTELTHNTPQTISRLGEHILLFPTLVIFYDSFAHCMPQTICFQEIFFLALLLDQYSERSPYSVNRRLGKSSENQVLSLSRFFLDDR